MSDVITVDMDTLEEEVYVESNGREYAVFSGDSDGEMLSATYEKKESAQIWMAGWHAAMERVESRS